MPNARQARTASPFEVPIVERSVSVVPFEGIVPIIVRLETLLAGPVPEAARGRVCIRRGRLAGKRIHLVDDSGAGDLKLNARNRTHGHNIYLDEHPQPALHPHGRDGLQLVTADGAVSPIIRHQPGSDMDEDGDLIKAAPQRTDGVESHLISFRAGSV